MEQFIDYVRFLIGFDGLTFYSCSINGVLNNSDIASLLGFHFIRCPQKTQPNFVPSCFVLHFVVQIYRSNIGIVCVLE